MVIINAKINTCDHGQIIESGYIVIKNGKIAEVGDGIYRGDEAELYDAAGCLVTPGFIDSHCHIGIWESGLDFEGDDTNEMTDPSTPQIRAIDAVNPLDRAFREALEYGITTVSVGPGSANPVAGQVCVLHTAGSYIDKMVLKAPSAMKFALGENPKKVYNGKEETPATRMAIASVIREQLMKAKRYQQDLQKSKDEEDTDPPELDMKCEALLPVLERKIKAHFHAHRADDICTAIRIAKEFDVGLTLEHVTEGHLIVDELAKESNIPMAVGPSLTFASKFELQNKSWETPGVLAKAGCHVSIITDNSVIPQQYLPLCAGMAVKAGMDPFAALQAITINPAKHIGIADRVGSIEVGKDADLVLTDGCPFEVMTNVKAVLINGAVVSQK